MDKPNFISLCVAGLASPSDIDDYVERWHSGQAGTGQQLSEFLGMNQEEYSDWVVDPMALEKIISSRTAQSPRSTPN
jgi:hypothetical protein